MQICYNRGLTGVARSVGGRERIIRRLPKLNLLAVIDVRRKFCSSGSGCKRDIENKKNGENSDIVVRSKSLSVSHRSCFSTF